MKIKYISTSGYGPRGLTFTKMFTAAIYTEQKDFLCKIIQDKFNDR